VVADGSMIPAPEGPIKERPANSGGKEFAGTGNVAPVVGEGGSRPAVVAEKPPRRPCRCARGARGQARLPQLERPLRLRRPPLLPLWLRGSACSSPPMAPAPAPNRAGPTSRAAPTLLAGVKYRVVEGKVDIGTVYRLQAVTAEPRRGGKAVRRAEGRRGRLPDQIGGPPVAGALPQSLRRRCAVIASIVAGALPRCCRERRAFPRS
jgi:hypothetical protein